MNQDAQKQLETRKLRPYYPLSNIPEAQLLIEQEYLLTNGDPQAASTGDRYNNQRTTSTTEIIIALGFITALLCCAGVQLYRAVNTGSAQGKNQTEKVLAIEPLKTLRQITPQKFVWRIEEKTIDLVTAQSLIDRSKF